MFTRAMTVYTATAPAMQIGTIWYKPRRSAKERAYSGDDNSPSVPVRSRHRSKLLNDVEPSIHIAQMDEDGEDGTTKGGDEVEQPVTSSSRVVI